ncbi:signaling lymphocytic activation molecule-like isoform X1 [Neoarius graeffei]|uniref:signaling lymphocytic activation molecule-like isoform X1 n=1 Tax=Neoarius graeffei TaxID=443677 RepID=UPI00298D5BAE|nr:signaling lymphocytic activation molecule-like isoform X1 [Neoarius graeffei]
MAENEIVVNIFPGKTILWTLLFLFCCLLCAAGDETVTLQEVEGTTITLHTGITGIQSDAQILWLYGPEKAEEKTLISQVFKGETVTEISERFKERLQLDRISGALTIRNISRNLSGVYLLHVLTGRLSSRTFSVSVYAPVSAPVINQRGNRSLSSTEPCFLLCSVENGEDVKLSWYRENERINITNNTDLSVPLNLTLQIQHPENNRNSYICVSANPVSNKTTSLNIAQLCYNSGLPSKRDHMGLPFTEQTDRSRSLLPALISVGLLGLLIIILAFVWILLKNKKQKVSETEELTYADVKISAHSAERVKKEENSRITPVEAEPDSVVYSHVK